MTVRHTHDRCCSASLECTGCVQCVCVCVLKLIVRRTHERHMEYVCVRGLLANWPLYTQIASRAVELQVTVVRRTHGRCHSDSLEYIGFVCRECVYACIEAQRG